MASTGLAQPRPILLISSTTAHPLRAGPIVPFGSARPRSAICEWAESGAAAWFCCARRDLIGHASR